MVRVIESQRWDGARLLRVTGTPIQLNAAYVDDIEATLDPHMGPEGYRRDDPDADDLEALARRVPIITKDLNEYTWFLLRLPPV